MSKIKKQKIKKNQKTFLSFFFGLFFIPFFYSSFLRAAGDVLRRLPLSDLSDLSPWCAELYGGIGASVTEVLLTNVSLPVLC